MIRFSAGERLKVLRELMSITREDFAELLGLDWARLKNIEQRRVRMAEDEYTKIGLAFPEIMPWLVWEGEIKLDDLKNSEAKLCRLIAAKIEAGQFPQGFDLDRKFISSNAI